MEKEESGDSMERNGSGRKDRNHKLRGKRREKEQRKKGEGGKKRNEDEEGNND